MPKQTLKLETIGDIDSGALNIAFNNALKLLTQDLADRPALDKARKLNLELIMKPVLDKNSHAPCLEHSEVSWQITTKAPGIGSQNIIMKPQQDGQLYFHSDLPDAPDDETIDDEVRRVRAERKARGEA